APRSFRNPQPDRRRPEVRTPRQRDRRTPSASRKTTLVLAWSAADYQSNRRFRNVRRCIGLQCRFPMTPVAETRIRVRYAETDQMGVVYYANYLIWMEVGRVEFCRAQGIRYRDMEETDGILLVVAEANFRYLAPARYDDEVRIATTLTQST